MNAHATVREPGKIDVRQYDKKFVRVADVKRELRRGWEKAEPQPRLYRDRVNLARKMAGAPFAFDGRKMRTFYPSSRHSVLLFRYLGTKTFALQAMSEGSFYDTVE